MKYQISITQQGNKFVAGRDVPGAYQANANTPLLAMRKWVHGIGVVVGKYRDGDMSLEKLAGLIGISPEEAQYLVEIETLVPEKVEASKFNVDFDWN